MGFFRAFFGIEKKKKEKRPRHRRRRDDDDDDQDANLDPWSKEGIAAALRKHFDGGRKRHGLKYRRVVGEGAVGVAALLQDVRKDPAKSYIIKRARKREYMDQLRSEMNILRQFRGAAHISKIVKFKDRGYDQRDELPGPYFITEYLENGTFDDFFKRTCRARVRVPNRVLWHLLLCSADTTVIRACVGLTWPPRGGEGAPDELERVPGQRGPTAAYAHNDLHTENVLVMIGGLQPDVREHEKVPVIKLIDFGAASQIDKCQKPLDEVNFNPMQGHASNMRDVGEVGRERAFSQMKLPRLTKQMMMRLITGIPFALPPWKPVMYGNAQTDASLLWEPKAQERYPLLDEPIRQAVGLMMACRYEHRPTLQQVLDIASRAVRNKRSTDYPRRIQREESSKGIRDFVNRYMFDADEEEF
ncbi:hypothetical protein PG991_009597 [Apiospora marii]|uniref:non-specific serine/threonine protein kinase n=1 Tax=Apiospora marii TaxID=335849 RepID=A0ABR1RKH2_9PEZI